MSGDLKKKACDAAKALHELKRCALEKHGVWGEKAEDSIFELEWKSTMSARDLAEQAMATAEELSSDFHAIQRGKCYCHACASATCEHSTPTAPGHIFSGFAPTGEPRWREFFQYLLALDDRRVDLLFKSKPELLASVVSKETLIADQLLSCGKDSLTYRIWGEVIAGYINFNGEKMAFSTQVVESQDRNLHVQFISDERFWEALVESGTDNRTSLRRIHDALNQLQSRIAFLSIIWRRERENAEGKEVEERVFKHLRHFANSIERKGRQGRKRTTHAEIRGGEKRPVHKASEDLKNATAADFFHDNFKKTIIVTGKNTRAHVFNSSGRHITSFSIPRDELDRRQQRKRYYPMPLEEVDDFKNRAKTESEKELL